MPPLKITVIEPSGLLYGSEYCLLDILDGLPRESFSFDIVMPRGGGFDQLLISRGMEIHDLLPRYLHRISRWGKAGVYWRLFRFLRKRRPDLIYLNQAGLLRAVSAIARLLRIPVVCQVQTLEDSRGISHQHGLQKPVRAFICNSEFIACQTQVPDIKKCTLYQGMSQSARDSDVPAKRDSDDRRSFTVGILGRIALSKGHYLLLDAAALLCQRIPACRFVVIGAGLTSEDTNAFELAVERAGLTSRFEMRGYRSQLEEELSRVDVLAIPSLAEPLGRVLFDAANFGVPVVVSDAGGLGEVCRRFSIGVPFQSGDANALAISLEYVALNYSAVLESFRSASQKMQDSLSMKSYIGVIRRILERAALGDTTSMTWLGEPARK